MPASRSLSEAPPEARDVVAQPPDGGRPTPARNGKSKRWKDGLRWTRWLHVYSSMIALLVVLFFGLTGITLNHAEWTLGFEPSLSTVTGTFPDGWQGDDGAVEFLSVSEFLRSDYDVAGEVTEFGTDSTDGFISYRGPGYSADTFFDLTTGNFELNIEQQGWVGIFNDLHKGRDSGSAWSWLIDISGGFLVLIALTGLGMQLFLSKRRRSALIVVAVGTAMTVILIAIALS